MKLIIISFCIIIFVFLVFIRIKINDNEKNKNNDTKTSDKNNYLDGIDVIYWINLDRSYKRKEHMETVLNDPVFNNIDKHRITAFDGKMNANNVMDNFVLEKRSKATIVEYATLLSHLNAIRAFAESKYEIALICEDDINLDLKPYWKKTVKEIIGDAPSDWEIIQLYYILDNNFEIPEKDYTFIDNNNFIVINNTIIQHSKTVIHSFSLAAYIMKKKAALSFINHFYKNDKYNLKNYLHVADYYIYKIFKSYTYKYPMFSTQDDESTIDSNHIYYNSQSKKYILNSLFGHDTKPDFPLYQL
jgi:GR25 family glycosyltransferase involved in LPS biosynthesis